MVSCRIADVPIEQTVKWVLWLLLAAAGMLFVLIMFPEVATWLPRSLGY
jgi:TRAP-type C4-dicarboxylate transport system permease large subunit